MIVQFLIKKKKIVNIKCGIASVLMLLGSHVFCQTTYPIVFSALKNGLDHGGLKFKDAVFLTENTYFDNSLYRQEFEDELILLTHLVRMREKNDSLIYKGKDLSRIKSNSAMFKTLTDTTITLFHDTAYYVFMPYGYDFDDIFGSKNWSNMFVTKLLRTRKGNCHSLPYLYKILADEIGVKAYLSLAPNHTYIKHQAEKGGWYNTELTSATFPIDAWLMASGYITLEAVQNGIYMDTLSEKESIALCVIDLAQGYNHKYPDNDGTFVIECCDLALKHFPDYVNAMLLKAETRLKQLHQLQKKHGYAYLKKTAELPEGKAKWDEMNSLYGQLINLGYRQMPEQMYVDWLVSLKKEKEKYTNKQVPGATKN
jgi:hypothetical protein